MVTLRIAIATAVIAASGFALGVTAIRLLPPPSPPPPSTTTKDTSTTTNDNKAPPPIQTLPDIPLLLTAASFSAHKHRDQRRKNPNQNPYINHPLRTAATLATTANITHIPTLTAALLHDVLEDTDTTPASLTATFGPHITAIVHEVSDDKALPKQTRKRLQIEHAPFLSREAKLVKLADKLDNLSELLTDTPVGWSPQRVAEYFDWAAKVVDGLRGVNAPLEKQLDQVFDKRHIAIQTAADAIAANPPSAPLSTTT